VKAATAFGLERHAKPVQSLSDYLATRNCPPEVTPMKAEPTDATSDDQTTETTEG
jgi:hypothetical protein